MNPIGTFTEKDHEVLGVSEKVVQTINKMGSFGAILSKETLSGVDFALLELGERGIREHLFTPPPKHSSWKEVIEERLLRWGYELVESPKAGDLVVYCKDKELTHMGIYLDNGKVKIKPGNDRPYYFIHAVEAFLEQYGSHIVYYRKNPAKEGKVQQKEVNDLIAMCGKYVGKV